MADTPAAYMTPDQTLAAMRYMQLLNGMKGTNTGMMTSPWQAAGSMAQQGVNAMMMNRFLNAQRGGQPPPGGSMGGYMHPSDTTSPATMVAPPAGTPTPPPGSPPGAPAGASAVPAPTTGPFAGAPLDPSYFQPFGTGY